VDAGQWARLEIDDYVLGRGGGRAVLRVSFRALVGCNSIDRAGVSNSGRETREQAAAVPIIAIYYPPKRHNHLVSIAV
jgi:hypothetical protein